jgi:hypothetical protein
MFFHLETVSITERASNDNFKGFFIGLIKVTAIAIKIKSFFITRIDTFNDI